MSNLRGDLEVQAMKRQPLSNTEAIVAQGMRPACPGEPFGAKPMFIPIEDAPYCERPIRATGPGPERFAGVNIELCNHRGALAKN